MLAKQLWLSDLKNQPIYISSTHLFSNVSVWQITAAIFFRRFSVVFVQTHEKLDNFYFFSLQLLCQKRAVDLD